MMRTRLGASALYFVVILVFGQYVLLNLTLAIVLNGADAILYDHYSAQHFRGSLLNIFGAPVIC